MNVMSEFIGCITNNETAGVRNFDFRYNEESPTVRRPAMNEQQTLAPHCVLVVYL